MAQNQLHHMKRNGMAAAAVAAATIGIISLAVSNTIAFLSEGAKSAFLQIGKAWIPGAQEIGPYSGKETVMVMAWLSSWVLLYFALRNKEVRLFRYSVFL